MHLLSAVYFFRYNKESCCCSCNFWHANNISSCVYRFVSTSHV